MVCQLLKMPKYEEDILLPKDVPVANAKPPVRLKIN
jgi:hypothetical protein